MPKIKSGYKKAFEGLETIYQGLQGGNVEVDELEEKLKKALEYIKICKEVLKKQEAKVTDILKEIEKEEE